MSARKLRVALAALLALLVAAPAATAATLAPGAVLPGDQLTCTAAGAGDTFEWLRDGTTIPGATAATYTTALADRGANIDCLVTDSGDPGVNDVSDDPAIVLASSVSGELFSGDVSGSVGSAAGAGIGVTAELVRGDAVVATGTDTTDPSGAWDVALPNAFANGRDGVRLRYSGPGAPEDVLLTAATTSANPYVAFEDGAGDNVATTGAATAANLMSMCFACVSFEVSEDGGATFQPAVKSGFEWNYASTFTRGAVVVARERHVGLPAGASMRIGVTVTRALPAVGTVEWTPPTCQADLATTVIRCRGALDPGDGTNPYKLRRNGGPLVDTTFGTFGFDLEVPGNTGHGTFVTGTLPDLAGGDTVELVLSPGNQVVTTLRVANLRAHVAADGAITGTCGPGQFLDIIRGNLEDDAPVCPADGRMSASDFGLFSYDDRSGGRTEVRVPQITGLQPAPGATVASPTITLKAATRYYADEVPGWLSTADPVSVTVTPESGGAGVSAANVNNDGTAVTVGGPGRYSARWTVTDRNGDTRTIATTFTVAAPAGAQPAGGGGQGGATPQGGGGPVALAAFVGKVSLQATRFRAAGKGGPVASAARTRGRKAPVGTMVTYRLTRAGTARFAVERTVAGRRKGRGCVKATKRNRRARSCKRVENLGSFTHAGAAGANRFRFTGRLSSRKVLRPGRYTLAASAGAGAAQRTAFRIVR